MQATAKLVMLGTPENDERLRHASILKSERDNAGRLLGHERDAAGQAAKKGRQARCAAGFVRSD
jgi:hypothetical protein